MRVEWIQYRGPVGGKITFSPNNPLVVTGKALTTASFSMPGTYVMRGFVADGVPPAVVTMTVSPPSSATVR
jgi:hypothetical protein